MVESCPRCGGAAPCITPMKNPPTSVVKYGCSACGFAFGHGGVPFIDSSEKLQDVFRGVTLAEATLSQIFGADKFNASTKAVLQARLLEYGMQMWNDGLKQGLLLGAIADGPAKSEERGPVPR